MWLNNMLLLFYLACSADNYGRGRGREDGELVYQEAMYSFSNITLG